jgi:aspartate oxidase
VTTTRPAAQNVDDQGVSPRIAAALRDAMDRLLAGQPTQTDGSLIKDNLWKEAGVSRATMNRAGPTMAEWNRRIAECKGLTRSQARHSDELGKLRTRLTARTRECSQLHHQLDAAATAIAALHHDNTLLRKELERSGNVSLLETPRRRQPLDR